MWPNFLVISSGRLGDLGNNESAFAGNPVQRSKRPRRTRMTPQRRRKNRTMRRVATTRPMVTRRRLIQRTLRKPTSGMCGISLRNLNEHWEEVCFSFVSRMLMLYLFSCLVRPLWMLRKALAAKDRNLCVKNVTWVFDQAACFPNCKFVCAEVVVEVLHVTCFCLKKHVQQFLTSNLIDDEL